MLDLFSLSCCKFWEFAGIIITIDIVHRITLPLFIAKNGQMFDLAGLVLGFKLGSFWKSNHRDKFYKKCWNDIFFLSLLGSFSYIFISCQFWPQFNEFICRSGETGLKLTSVHFWLVPGSINTLQNKKSWVNLCQSFSYNYSQCWTKLQFFFVVILN